MGGRAATTDEGGPVGGGPVGGNLGGRWRRLSLATRFALAAGVVLLVAAGAIGAVVTARIEQAVVRNSANATAAYINSVIAPITQRLAASEDLGPGARRALEEIFGASPLGERVAAYRFWRPDGRLVWSDDGAGVGAGGAGEGGGEPSDSLRRALAGEVVAEFDALDAGEEAALGDLGMPLLEVYSPIRAVWSGEVVAVAEFYEVAPALAADLREARLNAWAMVALTMGGLGSVLYAIVLGGSRTIDAQARALDAQMAELRELSARNRDLRLRVQAAAARTVAAADRTMRRIGADLHDGPAQHLAYAALRLDALKGRLGGGAGGDDAAGVARAVAEAMAEIRALSRGLQLPDIAERPAAAIVAAAAEAHEARTGHAVAVRIDCADDPPLGPAARVGLYRFVQEGLTNASRHAGGLGLSVALDCGGGEVRATLRDRGPGLATGAGTPGAEARGGLGLAGLGLAGLRDRVESLGGTFVARTHPEGGTELVMTLEPGAPEWTQPTAFPNGPPNVSPNAPATLSSASSSPTTTPSSARA